MRQIQGSQHQRPTRQ